jgi:hypothetical protein
LASGGRSGGGFGERLVRGCRTLRCRPFGVCHR